VAAAPVFVASGCTGSDTTADGTSDSTIAAPEERPADDPLAFTAYADPAVPITAAVGERFALLLDAEPTEGFRWEVVEQADPAVVLPLGSQFVPRDTLGAATTTTTVPPPVPDPTEAAPADPAVDPAVDPTADDAAALDAAPGEDTAPVTDAPAVPEPTTTTVPTRSVQVLSYVARAPGRTTITVRYVRIGTTSEAPTTLTFTVEVPVPPPLF
jgi:predicted secreted protein